MQVQGLPVQCSPRASSVRLRFGNTNLSPQRWSSARVLVQEGLGHPWPSTRLRRRPREGEGWSPRTETLCPAPAGGGARSSDKRVGQCRAGCGPDSQSGAGGAERAGRRGAGAWGTRGATHLGPTPAVGPGPACPGPGWRSRRSRLRAVRCSGPSPRLRAHWEGGPGVGPAAPPPWPPADRHHP